MYHQWWSNLLTFCKDCRGSSAVEYTMILSIIAMGLIIAFTDLGNAIKNEFTDTATCISSGAC